MKESQNFYTPAKDNAHADKGNKVMPKTTMDINAVRIILFFSSYIERLLFLFILIIQNSERTFPGE